MIFHIVKFLLVVLVTFQVSSVTAARQRCPAVSLANGSARTKSRGRIIQYKCQRGYQLFGEPYGACIRGKWDPDPPVCLKPGCTPIRNFLNGYIAVSMRSALLEFSCKSGYKLVGPPFIHCNGRRWSAMQPVCRGVDISCDFEADTSCGWTVESHEEDDFMWVISSEEPASRGLGTGPKHDHTLAPNQTGHYLMIETSDYGSPRTVPPARIHSPKFPIPSTNDTCFIFWYHMYGSTVGMLNVFLNNKLVFQERGNHGDRWIKGVVQLPVNLTELQLMIEGTHGPGYTGDIGLDDFSVGNSTACSYEKVRSCKDRCGEEEASDTAPCLCTSDCYLSSACCEDFQLFCSTNGSQSSSVSADYNTEESEGGDLATSSSSTIDQFETENSEITDYPTELSSLNSEILTSSEKTTGSWALSSSENSSGMGPLTSDATLPTTVIVSTPNSTTTKQVTKTTSYHPSKITLSSDEIANTELIRIVSNGTSTEKTPSSTSTIEKLQSSTKQDLQNQETHYSPMTTRISYKFTKLQEKKYTKLETISQFHTEKLLFSTINSTILSSTAQSRTTAPTTTTKAFTSNPTTLTQIKNITLHPLTTSNKKYIFPNVTSERKVTHPQKITKPYIVTKKDRFTTVNIKNVTKKKLTTARPMVIQSSKELTTLSSLVSKKFEFTRLFKIPKTPPTSRWQWIFPPTLTTGKRKMTSPFKISTSYTTPAVMTTRMTTVRMETKFETSRHHMTTLQPTTNVPASSSPISFENRTEFKSAPIYKTQGDSHTESEGRFSLANYSLPGVLILVLACGVGALLAWLVSRRQERGGGGSTSRRLLRRRVGSEGDVLYVSSEEMFDFALARPSPPASTQR